MAAPNTQLEAFMAILNRTGFDPTDIVKMGLEYHNAHPITQAFMKAGAEQVEEAARNLGVHAEQLRGPEPRALHKTVWDKVQEEERRTHGNS